MAAYKYPVLGDYRLGVGHDVALAAMESFEYAVGSRNRKVDGGKVYPVAVASDLLDLFPVRGFVYSGKERGDGMINHAWRFVVAVLGYKYILDTYLSGGTVVSAPVTLYTKRHEVSRTEFQRFNAYVSLPKPGQDITYARGGLLRVTLRFTNLVAL